MRYLFSQAHGNSTTLVIVENPRIHNGTVYATKVGNFGGWNDEHEYVFESCSPAKFMGGGGPWTLTEYKEQLL